MHYVMGDSFVIGVSEKKSRHYVTIVKELCEQLNQGSFSSKSEVRSWADEACVSGEDQE